MVPNADFIEDSRDGLTICDATSAAFGMHLPWEKLDITTFSWQKCLGGEAQHGVVVFSPRAIERIESFTPDRALPKFFRLTDDHGRINARIFDGWVRNTPSMMAAIDVMHSLNWVESIGGIDGMVDKTNQNHATLAEWVEQSNWVDFMANDAATRSTTAGALKIVDRTFLDQPSADQRVILDQLKGLLADEQVAFDIGAYFKAPPGLRVWTGPTIDKSDIAILTKWLDWAYAQITA
jgi:phosphoserine aminotransferase